MNINGLRDAHATLSALKAARKAMDGHANDDSATYLLLALVVLKIASDAADDHRQRRIVPRHDSAQRLPTGAWALEVSASTHFDRLRQAPTEGLSPRVRDVLLAFSSINRDQLDGVFDALSLSAGLPTDSAMRRVVDRLSIPALDFSARHGVYRPDLGEAVDHFLVQPGARRTSGWVSHVPAPLANLMASLVAPQQGDAVYDPWCHRGCLLLAAARRARRDTAYASLSLQGDERDPSQAALSRLRLLLDGEDGDALGVADPLARPFESSSHVGHRPYQIGVSCPPLTMKWDSVGAASDPRGRFWQGVPPRHWGHFALIQHTLAGLDVQRGRMAVLVPHGVLFREGEEARIRHALLDGNEIDAVIGLPDRLFTGASVSTALLLLRKMRSDASVLFVDAKPLLQGSGKSARLDFSIAERLAVICADRRDVPGVASLVPVDSLRGTDASLSVSRYVQPKSESKVSDLAELARVRSALFDEFKVLEAALNEEIAAAKRELLHDS